MSSRTSRGFYSRHIFSSTSHKSNQVYTSQTPRVFCYAQKYHRYARNWNIMMPASRTQAARGCRLVKVPRRSLPVTRAILISVRERFDAFYRENAHRQELRATIFPSQISPRFPSSPTSSSSHVSPRLGAVKSAKKTARRLHAGIVN